MPDETALEQLLARSFNQTLTPEEGQTLFSLQSMPQKININSNDIGSVSVMNKLISDNFQVGFEERQTLIGTKTFDPDPLAPAKLIKYLTLDPRHFIMLGIHRRFSRSMQLRGLGSVLDWRSHQGIRQSKLCYPLRIPPLVKERTLVRRTYIAVLVQYNEYINSEHFDK